MGFIGPWNAALGVADGATLADGATDPLGTADADAEPDPIGGGTTGSPVPPPPPPHAANPAVTRPKIRSPLLFIGRKPYSNLDDVDKKVSFSFISRKRPESMRTQAHKTS